MPALWEKVQREMRPGSLLISNSFPVPGIVPNAVIDVPCSPPRPLYCYEISARDCAADGATEA